MCRDEVMCINFYEGCTIEEIKAFRVLESEIFNFGQGDMSIDGWYGSEDAYYEMALECEYDEANIPIKESCKNKVRSNQYVRKSICKVKLERLERYGEYYTVRTWNTIHPKRDYLSKRGATKFAKKTSNKKVRQYKDRISNGGNYRKIFDYWWTVT